MVVAPLGRCPGKRQVFAQGDYRHLRQPGVRDSVDEQRTARLQQAAAFGYHIKWPFDMLQAVARYHDVGETIVQWDVADVADDYLVDAMAHSHFGALGRQVDSDVSV